MTEVITERQLERVLLDPTAALIHMDRTDSKESLRKFISRGWETLEPAAPLVGGWVLDAICDHLQAVTEGEIQNLLINVPPGCTKSMTTSVFWPAWEWGPRGLPSHRFIGASYAKELATRDNVRARDLMMSEWYRERWGHVFEWKDDLSGKTHYGNNKSGWRVSASSLAQLTGFRGDRVIIDDPHSVRSADSDARREDTLYWFTETVPSRLNDQEKSSIVTIMQRLHERDVSGIILSKELDYHHLMLPMEFEPERRSYTVVRPSSWPKDKGPVDMIHIPDAIGGRWIEPTAPEVEELKEPRIVSVYPQDMREKDGELLWAQRFTRKAIDALKKVFRALGGEYAIAGQLQQRPAPRGGGMFKKDDMPIIDIAPDSVAHVCRGWDLASTKDGHGARTAGVKMAMDRRGRVFVMNVIKGRWGPHDVETKILEAAENDGPRCPQDMPQDPGQAGKAQKAHLSLLLEGKTFYFGLETGAKEDRARPLASQAEGGNMFLVKGSWNDEFIAEACSFPASALKDQIDAASRAYARLMSMKGSAAHDEIAGGIIVKRTM